MPPKRPTPLSDELFAPPVLLGSTHLGAPVSLKNNFADMAALTSTPLGIHTPQLCAIPATPSPSHHCYMREGGSRGSFLQQATAAQAHERLYGAKQPQAPLSAVQLATRASQMQVSMGPVEMGWPSQPEVFSYPQQYAGFLPMESMRPQDTKMMQPLITRPGRAPNSDATRLAVAAPPPAHHADRDEESDEDDDDDSQIALPPHAGPVAKPPPGALHPSVGSEGHAAGTCKRCCFFPRGRCANGWGCEFCHYEHEKRKRKNKTKKKTPVTKAPASSASRGDGRPPLHQRPTLSAAIQAASQHPTQSLMPSSSMLAQVSQPAMGQCTYAMQTQGTCGQQQGMQGAGMQTFYQPYAQPTMMMYGADGMGNGTLSTVPQQQQQAMSMQPGYHVMRLPPAISHHGGMQDYAYMQQQQHQQQQQQQQHDGILAMMAQQQQQLRSTSYFSEVAPPPPPLRSPRLNRVFGQVVGQQQPQQCTGGTPPTSLAPTLLLGMHNLGTAGSQGF